MNGFKNTRIMEFNRNRIIATCMFITYVILCPVQAEDGSDKLPTDSCLRVYLPREITVEDGSLTLGQISAIRGPETLVTKANKVELGRISIPGQKIVLDRPTILGRLACNGISVSKVKMVGAEKITIKQQNKVIEGDGFVEIATDFISKRPPNNLVCRFEPLRVPENMILPGDGKDVEFSPKLVSATQYQAKVVIDVLEEGKSAGTREVTFRHKYKSSRAVAIIDIEPGTVIGPENTRIEQIESDSPEPANWKSPYGLLAKRKLPAKTVIQSNMVGPAAPAVIVERNHNVIIKVEKPGFLITAVGKAMEKGSVGDFIRVRNVDSQRIILVKINEDGTVEPAL